MTAFQDLTGQRFGKWTALEYVDKQKYLCRCDCGTERIVNAGSLRARRTLSCGCVARNELAGKKFDKLTVIERLPGSKYLCKCDCGNEVIRSSAFLLSNSSKSCKDCKRSLVKDITGEKFGRLTVIRYAGKSQSNQTMWKCECECGNTITAQAQNLKNGHTKSCGCYNNECLSARNRTHGETKTRLYNIWHDMCIVAMEKNITLIICTVQKV